MRTPRRIRLILLAVVAVLATGSYVAPADAAGPTLADSYAIFDEWAARDAPGLPNHCAGGRLDVTFDTAAVERADLRPDGRLDGVRGYADGWFWTGAEWAWDYTRCRTTMLEGMVAEEVCAVLAHEGMHFVIGPEHVGPLDPRHPGPTRCYTFGKERRGPVYELVRERPRRLTMSVRRHRARVARIERRAAVRRWRIAHRRMHRASVDRRAHR